jgi:hypothetical protein
MRTGASRSLFADYLDSAVPVTLEPEQQPMTDTRPVGKAARSRTVLPVLDRNSVQVRKFGLRVPDQFHSNPRRSGE